MRTLNVHAGDGKRRERGDPAKGGNGLENDKDKKSRQEWLTHAAHRATPEQEDGECDGICDQRLAGGWDVYRDQPSGALYVKGHCPQTHRWEINVFQRQSAPHHASYNGGAETP